MVAVLGMELDGRGDERVLRFAAVEVAVAAAGCALDGCRVGGRGVWRRHKLPAAVQRVAA